MPDIKKRFLKYSILFAFAYSFIFGNILFAAVVPVTNQAELATAISTAADADTISFSNSITITSPLPAIVNKSYTIEGNSNALDGSSAHRGFIILGASASPTIQNLTIQNTLATGGSSSATSADEGGAGGGGLGAGGAIYVGNSATASLDTITYTNSDATGGSSGA